MTLGFGSVDADVFSSSFPFLSGRFWVTMDVSDTSSTLTFSDPDELVGHKRLESYVGILFYHADIGIFMEAPADDKVLGRIALLCQIALDILCDKKRDPVCSVAPQVAPLPSKWPCG